MSNVWSARDSEYQGFADRRSAGAALATALSRYHGSSTIVLALPRGGVPVGYEVARALGAALDIWVVRKIGVPGQEELGLGAVAEGGHVYLSPQIVRATGLSPEEIAPLVEAQWSEVQRRVRQFRGTRDRPSLEGKTVIVVDDGIATGGTVRAVLGDVRAQRPARLVLAVPVAADETIEAMGNDADEVVCLLPVARLHAIGHWYDDFAQVSDDEVVDLLARARAERKDEPWPHRKASSS